MTEEMVPGDNATLEAWIEFAREAFSHAPYVVGHLEDLARRDGLDYRVGFSTRDFFLYLDAYKVGVETDRSKRGEAPF